MASVRKGAKPNHWTILVYVGAKKYSKFAFVGTEAAAKRRAIALEARKLNGELVTPRRTTVAEWLETVYKGRADLAPSTQQAYREDLQHLIAELGQVRLSAYRASDSRRYVQQSFSTGNRRTGGPLAVKTVRNRLAVLNLALKKAEKDHLVPSGWEYEMPNTARNAQTNALTRAEMRAWLDLSRATSDAIPVWLGLCTGLRRGEILGLRRCDVDLQAKVLNVRQTIWWSNDGVAHVKVPKTPNSLRTIELPQKLVELLRSKFTEQDRVLPASPNQRDERLVWAHPDGRPNQGYQLTRVPMRMSQSFGLRRIRFHDLRHTYATLLLEAGVSMNAVSRLLGHADVTITVRLYGHVTPISVRLVRDVFTGLLERDDGNEPPASPVAA